VLKSNPVVWAVLLFIIIGQKSTIVFLFMQLIYDKSKFKNNFFVWNVFQCQFSTKRTADTNQKELTDKQPLLKAVVDIARLLLYPKVQLWENR
jgi:hypothetical protein